MRTARVKKKNRRLVGVRSSLASGKCGFLGLCDTTATAPTSEELTRAPMRPTTRRRALGPWVQMLMLALVALALVVNAAGEELQWQRRTSF